MVNGFIAIDKPEGMSSARVVSCLKKILGISKIGHTGTLDPFATGLMLCGINRGTRLSRFFLHGSKQYKATLHCGIETDTQDLTGTVIKSAPPDFGPPDDVEIKNIISSFAGKQQQVPPVYSALKHMGKPLYEYARDGKPVVKPPREITVFDIRVMEIDWPHIVIRVDCSSGTYIRTLATDIGRRIGCGAHLKSLRRTESCGHTVENALTIDRLSEMDRDIARMQVIPMAEAIAFMPQITVDDDAARQISFGRKIQLDRFFGLVDGQDSFWRILNRSGEIIAVIERDTVKHEYNYCCVLTNQLV